jgi:hypothetical protein
LGEAFKIRIKKFKNIMNDRLLYLSLVTILSNLLLLKYNEDIIIANADTNTVQMEVKENPLYIRQYLIDQSNIFDMAKDRVCNMNI